MGRRSSAASPARTPTTDHWGQPLSAPGLANPGTPSNGTEFVTKAELAELRKRDREETLRAILSNMHTEVSAVVTKMGVVMAAGDDQLNARVDAHDDRLDDTEHKVEELARAHTLHDTRLAAAEAKLEDALRRLGCAESGKTNIVIDNDVYDRAIDPTFLWVEGEAGKMYTKSECIKAVIPWMADAKISEEQYNVPGKNLAKKFKIQFRGIDGLAAQLAARALRHQKVDDEWRTMQASLFDADGNVTGILKLYVNTDKSPKQRRTEIATRDVARLIQAETDLRVFPNKRDGIISYNFVTIARIECTTTDSEATIWWNLKGLPKLPVKLEKPARDEIKAKLNNKPGREPEQFEWEV